MVSWPIFCMVEERFRGEEWTRVVNDVVRWYQILYIGCGHISYLFVVDASEKLREASMNKKVIESGFIVFVTNPFCFLVLSTGGYGTDVRLSSGCISLC